VAAPSDALRDAIVDDAVIGCKTPGTPLRRRRTHEGPSMRIQHLIGGRPVESDRYFDTVNPATQEVLAEVAQGGAAEIDAAVAAAKAAFPAWSSRPAAERAKLMNRLADLIAQHVPDLSETETRDTGQVIGQTRKQLVPRAADNFRYFAEMCVRVDGHTYPTESHLNYTLYHPVGVCALVSPWNVPFMTATWKVAPALAFGNTTVLKMSELSPLTAARLGELALEAGIPGGVLNIVHGYGAEAGEPLVAHPDVRAISFTGSTATGNRIVKAAGLKKFSMELGGKSPFVVFEDADPARSLDAAVFMIFSNNGERCTAGSRILVQRSIYADFVARFTERAERIRVGDPLDEKTIVGPMISRDHLAKVRGYIELGPKEGARLACGGLDAPDLPAGLRAGNYVRPTVFADVDNRMRIAQEEIFGPVACLIAFDDEADAVRQANDIGYGLSSYVWTENLGRAHRVSAAIEAGMCFVNSQNVRDLRQPFGGTKASGTGREGGTWSYEVFLEPKNICVSLGAHPIPRWGL
jgi:5-carboxymethyl-2-hydroxymuconic-semialdehyde dehydrogenase